MCTGLEVGALAAAVAGTAAQGYAQSDALKKQNDVAAAGIIKQGALQKQGEADVGTTVNKVAQSTAATQAATAKQLSAYRAALQAGSATSGSASPNIATASKAYKDTQAKDSGNANDYVQGLAQSAATTEGTQLERVQEGQQLGDTAGKLGILSNQSAQQNYLTKLQIQGTKANPWIMGLGSLLQGAGAGMGGAAGMAAGAAGQAANGAASARLQTGYMAGTTPFTASPDTMATPSLSSTQNPWG